MTPEQFERAEEDRLRKDQYAAAARALWWDDIPLDLSANVRWVVQFYDGKDWIDIPGSETEDLKQAQIHKNRLVSQLAAGTRAEGKNYRVRTISDQPTLPL